MKKIFYFVGIVCALFSCTDLSEKVQDNIPASEFGSSPKEVDMFVGSAYNKLRLYWCEPFLHLSEMSACMAMDPTRVGGDWWDGGQFRELFLHQWTPNTNRVTVGWDNSIGAVALCNQTLSLLDNADFLGAEVLASTKAQVKGIRAFFYYILMDYYGTPPLVKEYNTAVEELPSNATRKEVFDWVEEELKDILSALPAREGNYGKFTKGSANAILAKMYLNSEAYGFGNRYNDCIEACKNIEAMGYTLEADYGAIFEPNNTSNEGILSVTYSETDATDAQGLHYRTLHYNDPPSFGGKGGYWNGFCAQPDYARLFDPKANVDAINMGIAVWPYTNDFFGRFNDIRGDYSFRSGPRTNMTTGEMCLTGHGRPLVYTIDVTMLQDQADRGTGWKDVNQEDGVRVQKWPYTLSLTSAMGNDYHIFRLADIYLIHAEAILRNGGNKSEALSLLNKVSNRAGITRVDATLPIIQKERRLELAWETWSRNDDIRFAILDGDKTWEEGMWHYADGSYPTGLAKRKTGSELYVFPIPQTALNANNKLVQNPGY